MKLVQISQLKSQLSHYLQLVRGGEEVTVTDRKNPFAKISPLKKKDEKDKKLFTRGPYENPEGLDKLTPSPILESGICKTDSLKTLLEERGNR